MVECGFKIQMINVNIKMAGRLTRIEQVSAVSGCKRQMMNIKINLKMVLCGCKTQMINMINMKIKMVVEQASAVSERGWET